jgi:hypothetical protein
MKYMLLIYTNPNTQMTEAELQAEMNAYWAFEEDVRKSGVHLGGEGLHPVTAATTVRVRDGKTLTTDGPFAETHEHLGGFYLIDVTNLDEAIKWAAKIPSSGSGSIEVRPVMNFEQ